MTQRDDSQSEIAPVGTAPTPPTPSTPPTAPHSRSRRTRAVAGFAIGLVLLAAAVWGFFSQAHTVDLARQSLRSAHPLSMILLVVLPLVNWVLSAESFLALTRRFAPVPRSDMLALIGSAWLFNYLPLRPGLFGRVAFHKAVHGVRVRDSARVIVQSILGSAVALAALAGATLLSRTMGPAPMLGLLVFAPGLVMSMWFASDDTQHQGSLAVRVFLGVVGLKILDGMVWTARYMLAFQLAGSPIGVGEALAVAVVAQAAMLIPLAGNGLGVREWSVALLAASLPAWYAAPSADSSAQVTVGIGLAADLICRAAELLIAVPTGLVCTAWIARKFRRVRA